MKGDMKYYKMFGGEKVIFDKEEVDQMKKFDQPGMRYIYEWNIRVIKYYMSWLTGSEPLDFIQTHYHYLYLLHQYCIISIRAGLDWV